MKRGKFLLTMALAEKNGCWKIQRSEPDTTVDEGISDQNMNEEYEQTVSTIPTGKFPSISWQYSVCVSKKSMWNSIRKYFTRTFIEFHII